MAAGSEAVLLGVVALALAYIWVEDAVEQRVEEQVQQETQRDVGPAHHTSDLQRAAKEHRSVLVVSQNGVCKGRPSLSCIRSKTFFRHDRIQEVGHYVHHIQIFFRLFLLWTRFKQSAVLSMSMVFRRACSRSKQRTYGPRFGSSHCSGWGGGNTGCCGFGSSSIAESLLHHVNNVGRRLAFHQPVESRFVVNLEQL